MTHKHELIKSPFDAVNQFETAFVKSGNEFLAEAVSGVLKYIASETATAIQTGSVKTIEQLQ